METQRLAPLTSTILAFLLAFGVVVSRSANAATFNKASNADALNLDTSWTEAGQPGASDTARFTNAIAAPNRTMELGASLTWNQISGANNGTFTINDTPGTSQLTLSGGGIVGSTAFLVLNADVALAANQQWGGVRKITLNGNLDNAGFNLIVDGAGGNDTPYSAVGVISGGGNLTFKGGKTELIAVNTYTGSTTVESTGLLYLSNENALGDSSTRVLNLNNGGSVGPDDNLSLAGTNPTPIVLSGGGRFFFDNITSENGNQTLDVNSDISGTGGLVVDVLNLRNNANLIADVTFGGDNIYSGDTTLRTTGKPTASGATHHRLVVRNGLNDALPTSTVLTFDNRTGSSGAKQPISYDLNGFGQEVAGLTQQADQAVDGSLDANAVVNSSGTAATLTVNNSADFTFHGWLGVDNYAGAQPFPATGNNFGLTKSGSGKLTLTADNSYTGATLVSGGTLHVDGSIATSSLTTVEAGAAISGSGNIGTLNLLGTVSPGDSPGTMPVGSTTWNNGADFLFEINQASGTVGTDPGWDLLDITGDLTLSGLTAGGFTIDITSLTLANSSGDIGDFDSSLDYAWEFVRTTTGVIGFDSNDFVLDVTAFSNVLDGGEFGIQQTGNSLEITFSAANVVPEPSAIALSIIAVLGLSGIGFVKHRQGQQRNS